MVARRLALRRAEVFEFPRCRETHGRYKKYLTTQKKYHAHDELGCQEGDQVVIRETRPMSKTKRWRVVEKLAAQG